MKTNRKKLFLTENNIIKLILFSSLPAIMAGVVDMLYNYVDSIFIGHFVNETALAAISINIAVQASFFAVGVLFIMGTNSNISRALGADDILKAKNALIHGFIFSILGTGILAALILWNLEWVLMQVGSGPDILSFSMDYAQIILWIAPINIGGLVLVGAVRAKGYTDIAMKISITGALCNIVLDALFIIVFQWGIKGAATATGLSQIIVFTTAFIYVIKLYDVSLKFSKNIPFNFSLLQSIVQLGLPTGFRIAVFSLTYIIGNRILREFGTDSLAAYSISMRTAHFTVIIASGIAAGMQPLIGYNYGAQQYLRVKHILNTGICLNLLMITPFGLLFLFPPALIIKIFTSSENIVTIGQEAVRFIGTATCAYTVAFIVVDALQAMGFYKTSFWMSLGTPTFICVGMIVFSSYLGVTGVWLAYTVAYTTMMFVALFIILRENIRLTQINKTIS